MSEILIDPIDLTALIFTTHLVSDKGCVNQYVPQDREDGPAGQQLEKIQDTLHQTL